jgi:hypothetical protein
VITNTGVTSLAGKTGELKLEGGTGITIDGLKISNAGMTSLSSGTGITVSGSTITNSDLGSSQNIFKTISVLGQDDIVAGSNTDTLTFAAGTGITLTTDSTDLTISSNDPSVAGGWTHVGTDIYLTTSTDSVGIGTTDPSYKFHVVGTEYVSDALTAGGALSVTGTTTLTGGLSANGNVTLGNSTSDSLTFVGRMANGTSLTPDTDLGSDLGSSDLRFNNLWVANINSNSSQAFSGQTTFSYPPTDTTIDEASVLINPTTSVTNGQLLGFGIAGYQKALIDSEGDMILGYSNTNVNPTRVDTEVLSLYGHSGTKVSYIDTSGNIYLAGNLDVNGTTSDVAGALNLSGNALTSSGALSVTPNAGNNLNVVTSGGGMFAVNTAAFVVTSASQVGIGTTTPNGKLNVVSSSEQLRLGYDSNNYWSSTVGATGGLTMQGVGTGGSLTLSPTAGQNLNISLSGTGDLAVNTNDLVVDTSSGFVGIGTTAPTETLTVVGDIASQVATGVEGLKLTDTSDATKLAMKWTGTGVTFDIPSLSTVNQLTNGTFETDITTGGWGSYTLNDQFTTDKTSAQLVGTQTSAEPTGGTRSVTDSASSWYVSGGVLSSLGLGGANDPRLYYSGISSTRALAKNIHWEY